MDIVKCRISINNQVWEMLTNKKLVYVSVISVWETIYSLSKQINWTKRIIIKKQQSVYLQTLKPTRKLIHK